MSELGFFGFWDDWICLEPLRMNVRTGMIDLIKWIHN